MSNTLVALYDNLDLAHEVLRELRANGFALKDISLVAQRGENSAASATTGWDFATIVGGLTGLVAGLVALNIPSVGPIIAAGTVAAILSGTTGVITASAGAVTCQLSAALVNMNVPQDKANRYAQKVRQGRVLVAVHVDDITVHQAISVMSHYLPASIQYRHELCNSYYDTSRRRLQSQAETHLQIEEMRRLLRDFDPAKTEPRKPRKTSSSGTPTDHNSVSL